MSESGARATETGTAAAEGSARGPSLVVVTPSYAPDFELCAHLVQSVRHHGRNAVQHHVIVPREDLARFRDLAGPTTSIHPVDEFLPRSFISLPGVNGWLNARRPFPPVRGWIAQQIVKLAVAASAETDVALLVDSDMVMVRDFTASDFQQDGQTRLYANPGAVTKTLPRHLLWHRAAREMLGLAPPGPPPLADYIAWPCAWDPRICRELLTRLEVVGRTNWETAISRQLHFSEMILYGVFAEEVLDSAGDRLPRSQTMPCVTYDAERPLSLEGFLDVLAGVTSTDVAVMVSAKSRTPQDVRDGAWALWGQDIEGR